MATQTQGRLKKAEKYPLNLLGNAIVGSDANRF